MGVVHSGVELEGCLLIDVKCGGSIRGLEVRGRVKGVGRGFEVGMGVGVEWRLRRGLWLLVGPGS